ncbi:plasma membrane calcium transporter [Malassezia pachydermatis]
MVLTINNVTQNDTHLQLPPPIAVVDSVTQESQQIHHPSIIQLAPLSSNTELNASPKASDLTQYIDTGKHVNSYTTSSQGSPLDHSEHMSMKHSGTSHSAEVHEEHPSQYMEKEEDTPKTDGFFSRLWALVMRGDTETAKMEQLKKELEQQKWKDPAPFKYNPGELCSLIDPEDFNKLEGMGGIDGLMHGIGTSTETGIHFKDHTLEKTMKYAGTIEQRTNVFGTNVLPARKSKGLLLLMWLALQDKMLILLIIASIVSLALGLYTDFSPPPEFVPCLDPPPGQTECKAPAVDWVEGVAILVAVIVVDLVGSINDWQKEKQFRVLDAKKEARNVTVLRDGKKAQVDVHDVVVGDIVTVEPGEVIAFDGVVLRSHNIKCDESSVTGESDMIQKVTYDEYLRERESGSVKHKSVFMISGSKVLEGVGDFVVTAVGPFSMHGKLMLSLRQEPENTPLQEKLNYLAELIAKLGTTAGGLLFLALMIRFFVNYGYDPNPDGREYGETFMNVLIIAVTVIVVAVPEGLPLAVTLALAFATRRMSNQNLLVRVLGACETMANATCICTDKTGTLTQNNMSVVAGCIGDDLLFLDSIKTEIANAEKDQRAISLDELTDRLPSPLRTLLVEQICINSTAFIPAEVDESEQVVTATKKIPWWGKLMTLHRSKKESVLEKASKGEIFIGSKTESALLSLVRRLDWAQYDQVRTSASVVQVIPFSSKRKAMGVVIKNDDGYRLYIKGASEIMVGLSTGVILVQESTAGRIQIKSIDEATRTELGRIIENYASQSLRTMGLCYRDFDVWPPPGASVDDAGEVQFEDLAKDLTVISIMAIEDPLRYGVPDAVSACGRAGVTVKMCTGDNILTASSIGKQCGLYTAGGVAIEGPVFRQLSRNDLMELAPHLHILARSSPEDKKTLIDTLKSMGEVVGVTGDGTNDGPALKSANVGFSMGIAGSEVAKEASDIILLDDNFSSIVSAIKWGRCVNDAVRKFLQFQLTVNVVAVVVTFVSAVSTSDESSVLTAVQLLWLNLIMDTLAALALATDPADPKSLNRKPSRVTAPLISADMWKQIAVQSAYQIILIFVLYYRGMDILNLNSDVEAVQLYNKMELKSLIFNIFVWCQLFNQVNARRLDRHLNIFDGIHRNIWFLLILLVEVGCQVLIIFKGDSVFSVKPLNGRDWGISLVAGFVSWPLGALTRMCPTAPLERLLIKLKLMKDPNALPVAVPNEDSDTVSLSNWNEPAIGQIAKQIGAFSNIRGGRLRASNLVLKNNAKLMRENNIHPHAIMAMVPAIIGTSVGGMWKMGQDENSNSVKPQVKVPASTLFRQGKIQFHPDTPTDHPYLLTLQGQT